MKTLAPLYIWSGDTVELQQAIEGLRKGDIAIVNGPDSGPPNASQSHELRAFVDKLQANDVIVIGYIPTGYARRAIQTLQDQAVSWRILTGVDGIFFDETDAGCPLSWFRALHGQVRAWRAHPLAPTKDGKGVSVFNTGIWDVRILDLMRRLPESIWNVWEGTAQEYAIQKPKVHRFPEREAHIIYGAGNASIISPPTLGYRFITTDAAPNAFDTFPEGMN